MAAGDRKTVSRGLPPPSRLWPPRQACMLRQAPSEVHGRSVPRPLPLARPIGGRRPKTWPDGRSSRTVAASHRGGAQNHPHSCRLAVSAAGGPQHHERGLGNPQEFEIEPRPGTDIHAESAATRITDGSILLARPGRRCAHSHSSPRIGVSSAPIVLRDWRNYEPDYRAGDRVLVLAGRVWGRRNHHRRGNRLN